MSDAAPLPPMHHALPLPGRHPLAAITQSPQALALHAQGKTDARMNQAAQEFEAVFLSEMMVPMFDTVEQDEIFGGGYAEDVYRSLLVDEYGKLLARSGGIGIAATVKQEMLSLQEKE